MSVCFLCPRHCGVARPAGFCGAEETALIARAARHMWEEPCISGERGSGTVFFTGCNLGCVYCQNDAISHRDAFRADFRRVDAGGLRELCLRLRNTGVHNINFVTPSHHTSLLADAIGEGFGIPVVYNSGGYDSPEALRTLEGKVQIYLPDFKYALPEPAARYSHAPDYPAVAKQAILEMFRQVGPYELDEDGLLRHGVVIRHLVLPGQLENTRRVIDWVGNTFSAGQVLFSLMGQFTPRPQNREKYPELFRPLTPSEYNLACSWVEDCDSLEGYVQDLDSACEDYIPDWGVFEG